MALANGQPRFDQATIGRRIRAKREAMGYTAAGLGELVGIADSAMLKKEVGTAPFKFEELARIGDVLGAPALFPVLDWDVAEMVERLLPSSVRATTTGTHGGKP